MDKLFLIQGSYEDYAPARPISTPQGKLDLPEEFREDRVAICQDKLGSGLPEMTTQCQPLAHRFHSSYLKKWSQNQRGSRHFTCPPCRRPLQFTLYPPLPQLYPLPQRRILSSPRAGTREVIFAFSPKAPNTSEKCCFFTFYDIKDRCGTSNGLKGNGVCSRSSTSK